MIPFDEVLTAIQKAIRHAPVEESEECIKAIRQWKVQDSNVTSMAFQHPLFAALMNTIEDELKP